MNLMGVDVGFSKNRETTGIARLDGDNLYLSKTRSSWKEVIPKGFHSNLTAYGEGRASGNPPVLVCHSPRECTHRVIVRIVYSLALAVLDLEYCRN